MSELSRTIVVRNPSGFHARPANELARLAKSLHSPSRITVGGRSVNAASVLAIMTLGIAQGTEIEVTCEGPTAQADLDTLVAAIEGGLGEIVSSENDEAPA